MILPEPTEQGRQHLLRIAQAIGLDPHNISLDGFHLDGDNLTVLEFVRNSEGNRYMNDAGSEFVKRERTYRLHPVELIHEESA